MTDQPPLSAGAVPELPVVAWCDPHAHWIRSADGLTSWNPAPDASPAAVPNAVTVTLKVGNEFARYHPQASHVSPDHRDGWNRCFDAAQATIHAQAAEIDRLKRELAEARIDVVAARERLRVTRTYADTARDEFEVLKVKQVAEADEVMRLAEEMAALRSWDTSEYNAAREALRAFLTKDRT